MSGENNAGRAWGVVVRVETGLRGVKVCRCGQDSLRGTRERAVMDVEDAEPLSVI